MFMCLRVKYIFGKIKDWLSFCSFPSVVFSIMVLTKVREKRVEGGPLGGEAAKK